jgi:hypothetical protein
MTARNVRVCRKVKYALDTVRLEQRIEGTHIVDVHLYEFKRISVHQLGEVCAAAKDQVIRGNHVMALRNKSVAKMTSYEACSASNEDVHGAIPFAG